MIVHEISAYILPVFLQMQAVRTNGACTDYAVVITELRRVS
jgi:hypothetical protein